MENNLFEMIRTGGPFGDCTCNYRVEPKCEFTVKEFVDEVLKDKCEWGDIKIDINHTGRFYGIDGPKIVYKHGKLTTPNFSDDILRQKVEIGRANGGWTYTCYTLILKKEKENEN